MRPHTIDDYMGQQHILGTDSGLRKAILSGAVPSMILWGPPGVGKTTLAQIIAHTVNRPFYALSAISSGVKDIRAVIEQVTSSGLFGSESALLFVDEIHRFSKSQQDALLGVVEKGQVTLIGATTENPSFEVNASLLSRCQVYTLTHFSKDDLVALMKRALEKDEQLRDRRILLKETDALLRISGGDARKLLNGLEVVVHQLGQEPIEITDEKVMALLQHSSVLYSKKGEEHYDMVSALIKSIRGSDPNAAVYWLARMVEGGEEPKFIARRLIIAASEDIGLANPNALVMANAAFDAIHKIGWPEGRIPLAQCVIYLAASPKGNAAYKAIQNAQLLVKKTGDVPVPLALRNAPTSLMKEMGYGSEYRYSHDGDGNFVRQEFFPETLSNSTLYTAGSAEREKAIAQRIQQWWGDKYG